MSKIVDRTGVRNGRLIIVSFLRLGDHGAVWLCECDCGNKIEAIGGNLRKGHTESCGCYRKDRLSEIRRKHGLSETVFYGKWHGMKQRCLNKNAERYKSYGGRGISFSPTWLSFECFHNDMFESFLAHCDAFGLADTTLGRKDNERGYSKENCRWETRKQQMRNRQNSIWITYGGRTMNCSAWAEELGFRSLALQKRIRAGWSPERALTTPIRSHK